MTRTSLVRIAAILLLLIGGAEVYACDISDACAAGFPGQSSQQPGDCDQPLGDNCLCCCRHVAPPVRDLCPAAGSTGLGKTCFPAGSPSRLTACAHRSSSRNCNRLTTPVMPSIPTRGESMLWRCTSLLTLFIGVGMSFGQAPDAPASGVDGLFGRPSTTNAKSSLHGSAWRRPAAFCGRQECGCADYRGQRRQRPAARDYRRGGVHGWLLSTDCNIRQALQARGGGGKGLGVG